MPEIRSIVESAAQGKLEPVQVLVGSERFLVDRAVKSIRAAATAEGVAELNQDIFVGKEASAAQVINAAQTLPMMAPMRFVLVRGVDGMSADDQSRLASYLAEPCETTCLILTAEKLDGRGKLAKASKKQGVLFDAKPIRGAGLRGFVQAEAKARGHVISGDAVAELIDAIGDDLAALDDALERVSLYAGPGQRIDAAIVQACISRVRIDSIWALVDAIGLKDRPKAVTALASLLADREPPLRLLAMVARQLRIIARMREALAGGAAPEEAARIAGAPPFKARELTASAKRFSIHDLSSAFSQIAQTDRALKGSKRPPDTIIHQAVLGLCR